MQRGSLAAVALPSVGRCAWPGVGMFVARLGGRVPCVAAGAALESAVFWSASCAPLVGCRGCAPRTESAAFRVHAHQHELQSWSGAVFGGLDS